MGTKKDEVSKRQVQREDDGNSLEMNNLFQNFLASLKRRIPIFKETSAKTGESVKDAFGKLALSIVARKSGYF